MQTLKKLFLNKLDNLIIVSKLINFVIQKNIHKNKKTVIKLMISKRKMIYRSKDSLQSYPKQNLSFSLDLKQPFDH